MRQLQSIVLICCPDPQAMQFRFVVRKRDDGLVELPSAVVEEGQTCSEAAIAVGKRVSELGNWMRLEQGPILDEPERKLVGVPYACVLGGELPLSSEYGWMRFADAFGATGVEDHLHIAFSMAKRASAA